MICLLKLRILSQNHHNYKKQAKNHILDVTMIISIQVQYVYIFKIQNKPILINFGNELSTTIFNTINPNCIIWWACCQHFSIIIKLYIMLGKIIFKKEHTIISPCCVSIEIVFELILFIFLFFLLFPYQQIFFIVPLRRITRSTFARVV